MPSMIAVTSKETSDVVEWLVESGRFENEAQAAGHLIEYAVRRKYDYKF